ncbi:MAG: hypothetical protein Q9159_003918 [Coniocarpon cinnabarinum]
MMKPAHRFLVRSFQQPFHSAHSLPSSTRSLAPKRCVNSTQPRLFTTSHTQRKARTIEQARAHARMGPFNPVSFGVFLLCGIGMYWYFQNEKAKIARKKTRDASKGYGKPRIGGEFELMDQHGQKFSSADMKGKFSLIYFGFSHCPDICPDELDKMGRMIDQIKRKRGDVLLPIVVTCDPARDTPEVLKKYLEEFHPDMIGLTGSWEDIRNVCKAYRVYFSTPPQVKPGQDYLVDHSIYFYLMDPDGDFIEVIGREHPADKGAKVVTDHIGDWDGPLDRS